MGDADRQGTEYIDPDGLERVCADVTSLATSTASTASLHCCITGKHGDQPTFEAPRKPIKPLKSMSIKACWMKEFNMTMIFNTDRPGPSTDDVANAGTAAMLSALAPKNTR